MKRGKLTLVAVVLSGSLLFSSCVGSFSLFNRLSSWNQSVGNKFVNELVFLAFNIVPVYGVAYLADALVINSIEFWRDLPSDVKKWRQATGKPLQIPVTLTMLERWMRTKLSAGKCVSKFFMVCYLMYSPSDVTRVA